MDVKSNSQFSQEQLAETVKQDMFPALNNNPDQNVEKGEGNRIDISSINNNEVVNII